MTDIILTLIILAIVGFAVVYIYKQKKKGVKCIGCSCSKGCSCGCNDLKNKTE